MKVHLFKEWRMWKSLFKVCFRDNTSMTLGVVQLRSSFYWDMVSHRRVFGAQHFEKVWIFGPLKMRPLHWLKMSGTTHPLMWYHIPEEWRLHDFYILNGEEERVFVSLNGEDHEQKMKLNNYLHTFA